MYEIAVLVLICGVAVLGLYVNKLHMDVRILREKVKVLDRQLSDAFWKKILQKEEEKRSGDRKWTKG